MGCMYAMDFGSPERAHHTDCPLVQVPLSPSAFPIFQTIKTRTFYVSALHDEF
jgi:hypothetical protein